ncbi:MAG: lysylphosphatidylglycerol synthase transmembrane domain-containing protein [Planctomycetota bacterium]|nr:lysylphosphatidylglycerol synthase transmembrane domain-containing protein [Planctomycetota bacterium]
MSEPAGSPLKPERKVGGGLFEAVRRERSEKAGRGGGALRILGVLVFGLALWLISQNISWLDELRIERPGGATPEVLNGTLDGDWRERPLTFLVGPGPQTSRGQVEPGERLTVEAGRVLGAGGRVVANLDPDGADGTQAVTIEVQPGLSHTLAGVRPRELLLAFALLALATLTVATRWWRLLMVHDCPTRWRDAVRFTYLGLFFNVVFPGSNGGDVARAVSVVQRNPARRPEALMSVVVDRVLGLVSMVLLGATFVLSSGDRAAELKVPVSAAAASLLVGGAVFCSRRVRRWVRFEALVARLPMGERLKRLDRSARLVVSRPRELGLALLLSSFNHLLTGAAVSFIALALGSELGFAEWMSTTAIANTISGLPISPGGLGVGEHLFGSLSSILGSTYAMGVATSLVYRLGLYGLSLAGGLALLLPGPRPDVAPR